MLDKYVNLATVFEYGSDVSAFFTDAVVYRGLHLATQGNHVFAADDVVVKLFFRCAAKDQTCCTPVVDTELALQAICWFFFAGEFEHQRVHAQFDAFHVFSFDTLFAQLHARINAGVDDDAARKWLVSVEADFKALAEFVGNFVPVVFGRDHLGPTARRFERFPA